MGKRQMFRSAHRRERSEILDERECCSWGVARIRAYHTGLREVSVELLVLHLVEQLDARRHPNSCALSSTPETQSSLVRGLDRN
jgi:hypothetical protein